MKPFEGLYNPPTQILSSLKRGYRDYCYSARDKKNVLNAIAKTNLAIMWEDYYNRYGEYDYTVFIPARYRLNGAGPVIKGICYNRDEIPLEYECKIVEENFSVLVKRAGEKVPLRNNNE